MDTPSISTGLFIVTLLGFAVASLSATSDKAPLPDDCRESTYPATRTWQPDEEEGFGRALRLSVDVDGDGQNDQVKAHRDSGSGFSMTEVRLELTASDSRGSSCTDVDGRWYRRYTWRKTRRAVC